MTGAKRDPVWAWIWVYVVLAVYNVFFGTCLLIDHDWVGWVSVVLGACTGACAVWGIWQVTHEGEQER